MRSHRVGLIILAAAIVALALLLAGVTNHRPTNAQHSERPPSPQQSRPAFAWRMPRPIPLSSATVTAGSKMGFAGQIVSRKTNVGVAKAEITFSRGGLSYSATTASDGSFSFDVPSPGTYEVVSVIADGYFPLTPATGESPLLLTARPGSTITGIVIAIDPDKAIKAKVIGPDGAPVPAASVTLQLPASKNSELVPLGTQTTTDDHGIVEIHAPAGTVVEAQHPAFASVQKVLSQDAWDRGEITLQLSSSSRPTAHLNISGRVVDSNNVGVPDVEVIARPEAKNRVGRERDAWVAYTRATGEFELTSVDDGSYSLLASAPGWAPAGADHVQAGSSHIILKLRQGGGWITGRVISRATSKPIPSFVVVVSRPVGKIEEQPLQTRSYFDAQGEFQIGPLESNDYNLRVAARGYAISKPMTAHVAGDDTVRLDVELSEGASVVGKVVDAVSRNGISGARVELEGGIGGDDVFVPIEGVTATAADGQFELKGVPAGPRSIACSAPGYNSRITSGLTVGEGGTVGPVEIALTQVTAGGGGRTEIVGIGAALTPERDVVLIGKVIDGGGAAEAGIVPGDRIIAIDGQPVATLDFNGIVQRIRGPEGTSVVLLLKRQDGSQQPVVVVRRLVRG